VQSRRHRISRRAASGFLIPKQADGGMTMSASPLLRSSLFAVPLLCAAACAHAPAVEAPVKTEAAPQLAAKVDKPATPPTDPALIKGQAQLDAALQKLSDVSVFFQFDEAVLTGDAAEKLAAVGDVLAKNPKLTVRVEGNCDERGSEAYNLALGQRRAEAARAYLVKMGAQPGQVATVSFGAEKPKVQGHDEAAWSQNRRDDVLSINQPQQ
jgi:peptidoglycan-associated lipoprotein